MDTEAGNLDQLTDAGRYLEQAYLDQEAEKYKEALDACAAVIEIVQPVLAETYNLRGVVLEELGRNQDALEAYNKALFIKPGFRAAADNLVALESALGIEHRLVTIATFSHATEAYIPKTKLESEGIWSFVADAGTATANWLYSNAIGGVKLQVKESDVEEALEILDIELDDTEVTEDEVDEDEGEVELTCPECHSNNIRYERFARRPLFASWLLLGFPLPFLKRKWKCGDCGHEWRLSH